MDEFLAKMDDKDYWRTIKDKVTGQEVILTDEHIAMIQRLQKSSYPELNVDPYEVYQVSIIAYVVMVVCFFG